MPHARALQIRGSHNTANAATRQLIQPLLEFFTPEDRDG